MSEVARIIDELERDHSGDAWHGSPVRAILDGITAQQAASRPLPGAHCIWEIVLHMTGWKNEVRKRVLGAPAGMPEAGDWPAIGDPTPERWQQALSRFEDAHASLVSAVGQLAESKVHEPTNDTRDRALGVGVSHYVLLHGIVQHDAYHAGQIALLKKAIG